MSVERPVLVVDGDADLREILVEQLAVAGEFVVAQAGTLREAEALLLSGDARFDALILDPALPDGDGRTLCAALRERGNLMPIVALIGPDATSPPSADEPWEPIAKPFRLAELLTCLRRRLRDVGAADDTVVEIGRFLLHPLAKSLTEIDSERRIRLTEKEVAILRFLHRAGPIAVTRQVLLNEVWGYNATVATHTLETHIYRLRRKIEQDPAQARMLLTEGGGYRLDPTNG